MSPIADINNLNAAILINGAILVLANNCAGFLKSVPAKLKGFLFRHFSVSIELQEGQFPFDVVKRYVTKQKTIFKPRNFSIAFYREEFHLPPAPGVFLIWYRGHLCVVSRTRRNLDNAAGGSVTTDEMSIRFFLGDDALVKEFLWEAERASHIKVAPVLQILYERGTDWCYHQAQRIRDTNSVILRDGVMESLCGDIEKFLGAQHWYHERGIPYRRGYMFHGEPGSGKTSVIKALASRFDLKIATVALNGVGIGDTELSRLFASLPLNTCVLLEDIDCLFEQRTAADDKMSRITFSGLLNALDGVSSSEGYILFVTTNHPEKLDPALVRPGRIDVRQHIGNAVPEQAERYFNRFYGPGHEQIATQFGLKVNGKAVSMAFIQDHLLSHRADPEKAEATFNV